MLKQILEILQYYAYLQQQITFCPIFMSNQCLPYIPYLPICPHVLITLYSLRP